MAEPKTGQKAYEVTTLVCTSDNESDSYLKWWASKGNPWPKLTCNLTHLAPKISLPRPVLLVMKQ